MDVEDLPRVLARTAKALAPLELHLCKNEICLFTDEAMRDLRNLAMNARAARSALRQAIQGGRGDEPELDRALAMVEEANELLGRAEGLEEAVTDVAVRQGGDTPGDETAGGDSGEPRPGEPTEGREQGGQRSGAYVPGAEVLRGVQGGRQFGLLGTRGAGDQAAVVETGERGGGARIDQPGVQARVGGRRGGVVRDDAAAVRERTARIRAELAEILESQGGALVVGEGPGAGLRIGVRPGGFTRAGTAGHANRSEGFTRANTVGRGAPAMAFGTGQPDVREPGLIQAPGRARFGQGGLGRGFAGRGRVPDGFDPQRRAARMLTELDVIFAGSTPPGRRNTRSARHLLETKLEDYGFTVERVARARADVVRGAGRGGNSAVGGQQAAYPHTRRGAEEGRGRAAARVAGEANSGQRQQEGGFRRAADLMIEGPEESVRGEASSSGAAGGGHAEGGADVSQGSDGVQEMGGPSGENGGSGNDEGVGLRLFEWEPKVFSLTSSRPTAELSGFEYVDKSEVSGGGCGKETCALASRAGGEIGACHCPVPLGEEFPFNRVCQCDEQIRGPNGECQFSLRDEELLSQKKLLVLGEGVVAGELMPKGTLTAVCKGKLMSEWEARQNMRFSNHVNNVVFVDDDRGRVWAYDHTEEGNVFGMIEHASSDYCSNVVGLRICGDSAREWGDNCPPRVALFTTEEVLPGFRLRWAKCDSGFDGEFQDLSDASQDAEEPSDSDSEEVADDDDVVMTEADDSEYAGQPVSEGRMLDDPCGERPVDAGHSSGYD